MRNPVTNFEIAKGGLIGMFLDPSGNRIGLYAPSSKRGEDSNG